MKWIVRALILIVLMVIVSLGWYVAGQTGSISSDAASSAGAPAMSAERPAPPAGITDGSSSGAEFANRQHGENGQFSLSNLLPGMGNSLLRMLAVIAVVVSGWKGFDWIIKKVKKTPAAAVQ